MDLNLTKSHENYIASQLASGDYQDASEVIREALRLHKLLRARVIEDLRSEIEKGWDGPTSSRTVQDIIRDKTNSHQS